MICQNFNDLNSIERIQFIGELNHAVMSDNQVFGLAKELIEIAKVKGLLEGVKIIPERLIVNGEGAIEKV